MENVGRLGKDLEREEERGRRRKRGEGEGGREGKEKEEERGGVVGRKWGHVTYYTVPAVGCRLSW